MRHLLKIISVIFISFYTATVLSQEEPDLIKAAIIYQVAQNITWPTSPNNNFIITLYGDGAEYNEMYQYLKQIARKSIHNKKTLVQKSKNITDLKNSHLVYISAFDLNEVANISQSIRNTSTLLITDEFSFKANIMINLTEQNEKISFQVNRANILNEGLTINEDLLLIGGSELDIRDIYAQMKEKLYSAEQELKSSQQQIITTQQTLKSLNEQVTQSNNKITLQENNLLATKQNFDDAQHKLRSKNDELNYILTEYELLQENVLTIKKELTLESKKLSAQKDEYKKVLTDFKNRQNDLTALENEINRKNQLLSSQTKSLSQKTEQIIKQQYTITAVSSITFIALIGLLFIFYMVLKYKKITQKLSQSNKYLKSTQKQLVESEKFAALGQLIAGVAHELNTPLSIAITSASSIQDKALGCKEKIDQGELTKKDLVKLIETIETGQGLALRNLQRCANLISSFKKVSTDQSISQRQSILLRDYICEIMQTLAIELKRNNVIWKVEGDNPKIFIDPGFLAQVINNIIMNAINHAFENTSFKEVNLNIIQVNERVKINITDNGSGMNEQTLVHLFEPFYTTKRNQGGTGLGMNIVYNLINQNMRGKITVNSELNKGTDFAITLPLKHEDVT